MIVINSSPSNEIRILIVDDHQLVQTGLRMLIESQPEMTVVGKAHTGAEALALAADVKPDLILLDIDLGGENGLDLLPELRRIAADARVLGLTGLTDEESHRQAARLGAAGLGLQQKEAEGGVEGHWKVY